MPATASRYLLIMLLFVGAMPTASARGPAQTVTYTTDVEGQVTERASGLPIDGAQVTVAHLGLTALTDAEGRFSWRDIPLPQVSLPTTITVSASGLGGWTIENVRLLADDTLILAVELDPTPTHITVPPPQFERSRWQALPAMPPVPLAVEDNQTYAPLPATIRVRVTGYPYCDLARPYTVQTVDFPTYLKHVLPNEWSPSSPTDALKAGAMAAKTYAWYWIARGGKWPDADVYDSTCDQVYNPGVAYASTNAAVDVTWNWRLTRDGSLLHTSYRTYYFMCEAAGLTGDCMGIADSVTMAHVGYPWNAILYTFYADTSLSPILPPYRAFVPLVARER